MEPACFSRAKVTPFARGWKQPVVWPLSEQKSRLLLASRKGRRPLSTDNEQPQATFSPFDMDEHTRKRVRRTAIVFGLVALAFYFGFIVLTLVRGSK
jgi:hypothetical protein